jgi:hypothetical protein
VIALFRLLAANIGYRLIEWAEAKRERHLLIWIERSWL